MLTLLSRWTRTRPRRGPDLADLEVTVYTRAQCCCCHKALDLLRHYQRTHRFKIETVDVDSEPELAARFGHEVPVVAVDGKVRFRGVVNPLLFERLLVAEGRSKG